MEQGQVCRQVVARRRKMGSPELVEKCGVRFIQPQGQNKGRLNVGWHA